MRCPNCDGPMVVQGEVQDDAPWTGAEVWKCVSAESPDCGYIEVRN